MRRHPCVTPKVKKIWFCLLGMKRFSCGSWSHPFLVVWWAVSRCGMLPARSGAEILGPCGTVVGTFLRSGFLSFFHRVKLVVFALSRDSLFAAGPRPECLVIIIMAGLVAHLCVRCPACRDCYELLTLKYPIQHVVLGVHKGNLAPPLSSTCSRLRPGTSCLAHGCPVSPPGLTASARR